MVATLPPLLRRLLAAIVLTAASTIALAQAFPSKPLRWVVAYPPGGGTDQLARTVGAQVARQTGQSVVIDNRPGGAGFIGAEAVARSAPDGYTLFTGDNGTLVYNSALFKKTPYDPRRDFAPVTLLARFPLVLLANVNTPHASASALFDQMRKHPGALSYASPGPGSPHHLAMELFKQKAGLFILHVPYRGSGGAMQDLIGGQVPLFVADAAAALPMIKAGKVKPMAVFSRQRSSALPDVPTLIELGYAGVEAYGWQGLVVPSSTPKEVIATLQREVGAALKHPDVARKLQEFGLELIPSDPFTMEQYIASETQLWHGLIKERQLGLD